jgi:serine kinase of HPr protein (carbohydrate metabolism regulator)
VLTHVEFDIAVRARSALFVHAGVVAWRGRAVLIPGASNAGKSTLVAELVRRGATYYSDEYAAIDAAGRVHPYARRTGAPRHLIGTADLPPIGAAVVIATQYAPAT